MSAAGGDSTSREVVADTGWVVERRVVEEVRSGALVVWRAPGRRDGDLVAMIWVHWHAPTLAEAEIFRLEWDPRRGGEAEVWRALEVLAGRPLLVSLVERAPGDS